LVLLNNSCHQIPENEFHFLSKRLQRFVLLQSIKLDLSGYDNLTDKVISNMSQLLKMRSSSLQKVSLSFKFCQKISRSGFKDLAEGLETLNSLKNLNLDVSYCRKIDDKGVVNLSQILEKLTGLQSLCLALSETGSITNEALFGLSKGLKRLTALKFLNLSFNG